MEYYGEKVRNALQEISQHLEEGLIPFWLKNGIDEKYGGYLTCFDEDGRLSEEDTNKYIVTQTRMIWGFSAFFQAYPENRELLRGAQQGVDFFINNFWDELYGGWYWKTARDGTLLDDGKVVYGQSFAIYALAEYTRASGDPRGLEYAERTFDLLQKYAVDSFRGGYYENLENDWTISPAGFAGGDRKSLDIHMHLLEAYTVLAEVSNKEIHKRRLKEISHIILERMLNKESGCGLNQFDLFFNPIPAIDIRRTWNAERETGETVAVPTDTTSYGHNVELAWLLTRSTRALGYADDHFSSEIQRLVDHSLKWGYDRELGGVFRDGPHEGLPLVYDKEWWQNSEVLVGYLDAYKLFGDSKYLDAFLGTWGFCNKYFINHEVGEWRQLLDARGNVLVGSIGNPWKAIYHSGRSMLECKRRLEEVYSDMEARTSE